MAFHLKSPAFADSQPIPRQYTGEGRNLSPPLEWRDLPSGTIELALLCEDPDAPQTEPFVHWIAYKIPADLSSLPEGLKRDPDVKEPIQFRQGLNSFERVGYGGPMPPKQHGPHRYFFKLYALDSSLPEMPVVDKDTFQELIKGHVLGEAQLIGKYERH